MNTSYRPKFLAKYVVKEVGKTGQHFAILSLQGCVRGFRFQKCTGVLF